MKELSIEEKAKRYDEAIERAKEFVSKDTVEALEYVFPELKESDDEKIMTDLIAGLNTIKARGVSGLYFSLNIDDILSLLEKQGEQKPAVLSNTPSRNTILNVWELGNLWKELTKGYVNTEHGTQLDYILKHWTEGEHYEEQKPVDIDNKFLRMRETKPNNIVEFLSLYF